MRMMMMTTGWIPEGQVVDGAVLAMTMKMTMVRVWRTCRAVRKGPVRGKEQRMGRGKGRGRGWETVNGNVLLNCNRQNQTQRAT
jgi:hypothetical protein